MDNSVEELLLLMSWRESEKDKWNAEMALKQFLDKNKIFIKGLCYSQSKGSDKVFRDFYRLLITDIWEKCSQYDDKRNPGDSPFDRVRKWLSYRMKSVIRDYWTKSTVHLPLIAGEAKFEELVEETSFLDDYELNESRVKIAIEKILKPIEIDVLQTHYEFKGYVPTEISKALCQEYKISESYRRVIKCRALKKIKDFASKKLSQLKTV